MRASYAGLPGSVAIMLRASELIGRPEYTLPGPVSAGPSSTAAQRSTPVSVDLEVG